MPLMFSVVSVMFQHLPTKGHSAIALQLSFRSSQGCRTVSLGSSTENQLWHRQILPVAAMGNMTFKGRHGNRSKCVLRRCKNIGARSCDYGSANCKIHLTVWKKRCAKINVAFRKLTLWTCSVTQMRKVPCSRRSEDLTSHFFSFGLCMKISDSVLLGTQQYKSEDLPHSECQGI